MSSRRDERDRDRRRRDRSCSDDDDDARERARKERRRKKKWDVVGEGASAPTLSAAEQRAQQLAQLARLQAAANPLVALLPGLQGGLNKKQRELYVGNLGNQAQEAQLKTVFTQALSAFEGYDPLPGPPVVSVSLCGGGTYAFVEFRDEQASATPPDALGSRRGSR